MPEFEALLESVDPYYQEEFDQVKEWPYEYDKYDWLLGLDEDQCEVTFDVGEAFRVCFIAATRTGKTFFIRRIVDEAYHSGWTVAILPDAKDEYKSSLKSVQKEFQNNLPRGEKPKSLPLRIFRPTFFNDIDDGKLPSSNERVSLAIKDLTKAEFQTLCGYPVMTPKQQQDFDKMWEDMKSYEATTVDEIETICEERGFTKVWEKIEFIKTCGLFDSRFRVDPIEVLKNKEVLVLNYDGFEKLDLKDNSLDQVFIILVSNVINLRNIMNLFDFLTRL